MSVPNDALELKKLFEADNVRDPFDSASPEDIEARKSDEQKKREAEEKRKKKEEEDRLKKRREEAAQGYKRLAEEIIPKLGMTVSSKSRPPSEQSFNRWSTSYNIGADRADGAQLKIYVSSQADGRTKLTVHLYYSPTIADDIYDDAAHFAGFQEGETPKEINISFDKTNEKIVSEIRDRLLSKFDEAKKKSDERVSTEVARAVLKRNVIKDASAVIGIPFDLERYKRAYNPVINKYFSDSSSVSHIHLEPKWNGGLTDIKLTVKSEDVVTLLKKIKGMMINEA